MKKLIFIICLALTSPAFADMDTARKAEQEGEFRIAFNEYLAEAKADNSEAMVMVGLFYAQGLYVLEDLNKSNEWMLKAAEAGNPTAQRNMAVGYKAGVGDLKKSPREAFKWYILAANQGEMDSQFEVAQSYFFGIGTARNMDQALLWYLKAAEQDDHRAQYNLASMYADGQGVAQDTEVANTWLEKAAAQNNHEALFTLGLINHQGQQVAQSYTTAADYFNRAFIEGKSEAAAYLAEYAFLGIAGDADPVKAYMWVKLGTEISSTMPGGQLSQESLDRLQQNRTFLESSLNDSQKRDAQKRMDAYMKDLLEE